MKKDRPLACCCLVIGALLSVAPNADAETRDGSWWVRQSDSAKTFYVLGSIDRTMLTGSIDQEMKHDVVGSPSMGEIVAEVNRIYSRSASRSMLVQKAIAVALYQIAQSAPAH